MSLSDFIKPKIFIKDKKYSVLDTIGEGAYAFVFRVKSVNVDDYHEHYALKKMLCQTEEQLEEAQKEIEIMTNIDHPNVLKLLLSDVSNTRKGYHEAYLLLPLYSGTVQSFIDKGRGYPMCPFTDGDTVLQIWRDCIEGLMAIHLAGYRHADFKPGNILLSETNKAVITDLGSACPLVTKITSRSEALMVQELAARLTTAPFRAPELFNTPSQCVIDEKADIWSFGCCMFAMLFSRTPFESAMEGLSTLSVMSGHFVVPEGHPWPLEFIDVVHRCLEVEPTMRLSDDQLRVQVSRLITAPTDLNFKAVASPKPGPGNGTGAGAAPGAAHLTGAEYEKPKKRVTINSESVNGSSTGVSGGEGAAPVEAFANFSNTAGAAEVETDDFGDFESADFNALWSSAPADGVESGGTGPCSSNESMTVGSAELTNGHHMFDFSGNSDTDNGTVLEDFATFLTSRKSLIEGSTPDPSQPPSGSGPQDSSGPSTPSSPSASDRQSLNDFSEFISAKRISFRSRSTSAASANASPGADAGAGAGAPSGAETGQGPGAGVDENVLDEFAAFVAARQSVADSGGGGSARQSIDDFTEFMSARFASFSSFPAAPSQPSNTISGDGYDNGKSDGNSNSGDAFASGWDFDGNNSPNRSRYLSDEFCDFESAPIATSAHLSTTIVSGDKGEEREKRGGSGKREQGTEDDQETEASVVAALDGILREACGMVEPGVVRGDPIIKQGPLYVRRPRSFGQFLTKKQVWMVLTRTGLVVRKSADPASKVHHMMFLSRPLGLQPSDTLAIGLNGLLVQGWCPMHFLLKMGGELNNGEKWSSSSSSEPVKLGVDCRFEFGFENKEIMGEWMDAIFDQQMAAMQQRRR